MTKKGPIETIREACEQWRKGLWDGGTREAITQACDALDKERVTLNQLTAFVVLLTDANRMTIAHALDLQGGTLNGGSVDTGERLTAICREWAQQARKRTKPYGFDFDDADHSAVEKAIAKRATMDAMPKSLSCERGALLAEICRGWLQRVEHDETQRNEEVPSFREGAYYRTRGGEVVGPLDAIENGEFVWKCTKYTYRADGSWNIERVKHDNDLLPGEVTVWEKPPASLPAGVWRYDGRWTTNGGMDISSESAKQVFADWTDPPKPGRYKVPGGGKFATWEGDAP